MSRMNRTLLLSVISKCQQLLLTDMTAGSAKDNQTSATDDRQFDKKDPYAEFMGSEPASTAGPGKFNPGLASERLDFEEESSLC
ncbi:unnamed protein product [Boreogadus saida]